ncbi:MAG TPA: VOC family protein [Streptosporangiaceae bacterium]|nr:VOC family protein [Streptosporangiaceae bacterium]
MGTEMDLVQSRFLTDDVERLAAFYAALLQTPVALNEYYVEVPAGPVSVGFSKRQFTEYQLGQVARVRRCDFGDTVLDLEVEDVDAEGERLLALGATRLMPPTDQPWGTRALLVADPEGHLINVFSRPQTGPTGPCPGRSGGG